MWLATVALLILGFIGQSSTPAPQATTPAAPAPKVPIARPQTAILGMSGGLFVFNDKHEIVGHCDRITGKVVAECSVEKGHTVTELVQGMINTLVPDNSK